MLGSHFCFAWLFDCEFLLYTEGSFAFCVFKSPWSKWRFTWVWSKWIVLDQFRFTNHPFRGDFVMLPFAVDIIWKKDCAVSVVPQAEAVLIALARIFGTVT